MASWATTKNERREIPEHLLAKRRTLVEKTKAGEPGAFEEYLRLNKGLFEGIIRSYIKWVSPFYHNDLRQEAYLGLLKGIEKYEPGRAVDTKPEGYIFSWVRAYVSNFARTHGMAAFADQESLSVPNKKDDEEMDLLDRYVDPTADTSITPETLYHDCQVEQVFTKISKKLLPKERVVAKRRIFTEDPDTLEDIGDDLGVSRERIRQIELDIRRKILQRVERKEIVLDV